ncbi:MAG: Gfo/Idh/MocA family oxidoreductase [Prolixibacteraceae bacterium]|jgi:UDP-N-acetyl-2-amino-2-deoxyglucuronate dehydrogenase|nr:Gfo/Idh/MocA family oxidoreductase [Prolixibacteraceae bacterium]NLX28034.1 Gfo/Idh/MocA family oxidoreductase [Bacteroidales bacterium]HPJ78343.1 Gfo/Idh/MocA family oxidoreductase [Prolixibacteraceae bacterium]HRV88074.1 Gfo/Idh/MocA family oxidoreductase [Prolixibacteraceae bacterium]
MKNFALIGAAGYIAPRHMKAIKETGHNLVCALDPYDGIGIMDSYFPEADFFTEPERFDRHLDKLRRRGEKKIDFVSICSPNYLHDAHIRMALRNDADAICEKPLVLNPWNLDALQEIEAETGRKIYTILQLRLHPAIQELRARVSEGISRGKVYDVDLQYITSRGRWYFISWKGNLQKSGGVATNIGVHFFDMLGWIFGAFKGVELTVNQPAKAGGKLWFDHARVNWFLSVDDRDLPPEAMAQGKRTFRRISIEGSELEFSEGFTDLHTHSYRHILEGNGFGLADSRKSIEIVSQIRKISL